MGIKASSKFKWGSDNLNDKIILVQGVGHVGESLVKYLSEDGAKVFITDINNDRLTKVSIKYDVETIKGDDIYDMEMDIYAPCALGSTLNTNTINRLKCSIVAGAANNQLEDEVIHGEMIKDRGIIYAPDFLINAGGLINVYSEINGYNRKESLSQTKKIFDTTLEILIKAESENITTHLAALKIAEQRIQEKINFND